MAIVGRSALDAILATGGAAMSRLNCVDDTGRIKPGYYLKISDIAAQPSKGKAGLVPFSRASIYRMLDEGVFPTPLRLSATRSVAWRSEDIQAFRDELNAGSGARRGSHE